MYGQERVRLPSPHVARDLSVVDLWKLLTCGAHGMRCIPDQRHAAPPPALLRIRLWRAREDAVLCHGARVRLPHQAH